MIVFLIDELVLRNTISLQKRSLTSLRFRVYIINKNTLLERSLSVLEDIQNYSRVFGSSFLFDCFPKSGGVVDFGQPCF